MIDFDSHDTVKLIDVMGNDDSIVRAAQVSVKGENEPEGRKAGLINYLMRERHGTPFEAGVMTFYFNVPIFTARQMVRHRIASVNELSGRYRELGTKFYVPSPDRPLVNAGSGAHPILVPGTQEQYELVCDEMIEAYTVSYQAYKNLLDAGIATEVARAVLPVGLYTEMYMTFNLRSLLNFLSLRTPSDKSKPQYEIAATAGKMEELLKEHFPLVWESFVKNGRVAP